MDKFIKHTLTLRSRQVVIDRPWVMGILNVTPDSFYAGCRSTDAQAIARRVQQMLAEGADVLDVGACSTRPGSESVSEDEELARLRMALAAVREEAPQAVVSVDTFRARVAERCVQEFGVDIINDVSGGTLDPHMDATVARLQVPYILMHMRGTPATMQKLSNYDNGVCADVEQWLSQRAQVLRAAGVRDLIIDPGFGFAKTLEQNYELLAHLDRLHDLHAPLLVGVSRKSMVCKALGCTPADALNGTTVLHTVALLQGAHILRVHDVKAAVEARTIVQRITQSY
ncbi:MAG: dihydropteroate synthase [Muribaculaceae bacterium]|nr:dihydropteroate synthase [Muribaculaceae bacterium]